MILYEGDQYPEDMGFERVGTFDADRFLVDGDLVIHVDLGVWGPLPGGEVDAYKLVLSGFVGQSFFVEWRCQSDAPNSEIPGTGGSILNAVGGNVINHFTITEDRIRIWRGNSVPLMFLDIKPGVFHTYRMEIYEDRAYIYFVDGQIVDAGFTLSSFPSEDARIIWGSKMWFDESTNWWDYVRFGTIPQDFSGDFDSDSDVDVDDFRYFAECAAGSGPGVDAGPGCRWADMDADADVDLHDFALFQLAFTGGG